MSKPIYSIEAPDQAKLKIARTEIEAVFARHDIAGVCVLHTPGMAELFYNLTPSYSVVNISNEGTVHIKSKLDRDHAGHEDWMTHDRTATANMVSCMSDCVQRWGLMFTVLALVVDKELEATHTEMEFVPDPAERRKQ